MNLQGSKGDTDIKNKLLDSVEEAKSGMIWEKSIETCTLPYVKQITSASLMHEAGHPKQVLQDNPEGWGGEGGGWGFRIRGGIRICSRFMLMYGKNLHNIVK